MASPVQAQIVHVTLDSLLEDAAKRQYGPYIKVLHTPFSRQQLQNISFEIDVISNDLEPKESRRTILDINMKEYTNRSDKAVDETLVRVSKKAQQTSGSRYSFSTTKGSNWGIAGDVGAQITGMGAGVPAGGSASIGGNYGRNKSKTTENETTQGDAFEICYEQEEKIQVPPMSHVKAKITTYAMKYEQGYVVKFSTSSSLTFRVNYKTRCQQRFWGSKTGYITAAQLFAGLEGYGVADGKVSFPQHGTLSWVGQGSTIDKEVMELRSSI